MRSVGIDVGRYSVKVVEVLTSNRLYEVTNAREYKILNPETNDQEIDILQTLNQISKDFDTDSARVVCSVRQQYISSRKLFFPFKERIKIQKSLAFELEDDIPLSIDKTVFDSKIIKFHESSAEVLAMACVADEIERTIELFGRGHIDPDVITPEYAAFANLYERWYLPPDEVKDEDIEVTRIAEPDKLIVHIGHSKTFVGVVSQRHLIWGRSVMWGAEKIASSISQSFQVPFMTALEMMPTKAFILLTSSGANKDQIKMSQSVSSAFEPLMQAIRLTIMMANTEYNANIQQIDILGGAGEIKNMGPFFTQELEKPANVVNPMEGRADQPIRNYQQLSDVFLVALGLAIEGLRRPANPPVNFRQAQYIKKNLTFAKKWEKWGYTAKLIGIAYVCYFIYGVALDMVGTSLEEASNNTLIEQAGKIANLKGGSATQARIKQYIRDNNKKAKLVKVYDELAEINSPVKWINDVGQILPPNKDTKSFEVRSFVVNNDEVKLQGIADTTNTIDSLQKALKGVAIAGDVKAFPTTIQPEVGKKLFAFQFKVKRKN